MTWIPIAILSAFALSVVNIVGSHILTRKGLSEWGFLLLVALMHLAYAVPILAVFPISLGTDVLSVLAALAAGAIRSLGAVFMIYALKKEEVSRVIPIVHTSPIFVAMLAVPLLGESLNALQWIAIVITVAGVVLVSINANPSSKIILSKYFFVLLVASFFFGAANIPAKYAMDGLSFWQVYALSAISLSSSFLILGLRPSIIGELKANPNLGWILKVLGGSETLAALGILLSFLAIERGDVSLVSAVLGSR
ncbi:MAG: EamA family transporter, partial [Dehalococcoidia bacterium]|nr:EamA family transporter [Dehalococcoidia bacterium]